VYKDSVSFMVKQSKSLDIICHPWASVVRENSPWALALSPKLPSWITPSSSAPFQKDMRDIYNRAYADPLVGRWRPGKRRTWTYKASGPTTPVWSFSQIGQEEDSQFGFTVNGVEFASIKEIASPALEGIIPPEWPNLAGWSDLEEPPPTTFWRTIVADRSSEGRGSPNHYQRICQNIFRERTAAGALIIPTLLTTDLSSLIKEYLELALSVVWGRKLMRTSNGVIGLAPGTAKEGDIVCILFGCSVPVVLRMVTEDASDYYFKLVGDCYLHGFMDGEALLHNDNERPFELR
jgi:hypothetical protein